MKPFHTYRDGLPPGPPGYFATESSVSSNKLPLRIGDIVQDDGNAARGVVLGIFGQCVVIILDTPTTDQPVGTMLPGNASDMTIIGHAYDVLREVARIEALANAKEADHGQ